MNKRIEEFLDIKSDNGIIVKALCPFHNEKTPSFFANNQLKIFKCFGCGVKGSYTNFFKLLNYPKTLIYKQKKILYDNTDFLNIVYTIVSSAKFNIMKLENISKLIEYFQKRNITLNQLQSLNIGFLKKNYFNLSLLDETIKKVFFYDNRLIVENSIIFPVFSLYNYEIIGFVYKRCYPNGSPIENEKLPKYFHLTNTPFFSIKKNLFFVKEYNNFNLDSMTSVVVVEGIFDVYSVHLISNLNFVVGTLGTQLTEEQNEYILSISLKKKLYIFFDNDTAGFIATLNLIKKIQRCDIQFINWELIDKTYTFKDVDQLIKETKFTSFDSIPLVNLTDFLEYNIEKFKDQLNLDSLLDDTFLSLFFSKSKRLSRILIETNLIKNWILVLDEIYMQIENRLPHQSNSVNLIQQLEEKVDILLKEKNFNIQTIVELKKKIDSLKNSETNDSKN